MSASAFAKRTLLELVDERYQRAAALRQYGIRFYERSEETLAEACRDCGLAVETVVRRLQHADRPADTYIEEALGQYPATVVIDYLKSAHVRFLRHRLPYMSELIADIDPDCFDEPSLARDLQFVFPLFVEDFAHHIYEEEETLFRYVARLESDTKRPFDLYQTYRMLAQHSIEAFAAEHEEEDDDMQGIRELTDGYRVDSRTGVYTKVVFSELKAFEDELRIHAEAENKVLFPKAAQLEKRVSRLLDKRAQFN